jgi:elongation factor 2 kinase
MCLIKGFSYHAFFQAFSHFTYEVTRGYKICVDIQGVGDLYTDPQIHTLDGMSYGEGNLGLRGMALFFRSHECNSLCERLKLKQFERFVE